MWGVSIVMGVPQGRWMVFVRENPNLKWIIYDNLGVPPFLETPMLIQPSTHGRSNT